MAARWVLGGYVGLASAGFVLHIGLMLSEGRPINWIYVVSLLAIVGTSLSSLRLLNHSLSQALRLTGWVSLLCVAIMVLDALRRDPQSSISMFFMLHAGVFALGLILGFRAALEYATGTSLLLLLVSIAYYDKIAETIIMIILAYAIALPAKLIERLIKESTAELTKLNTQLSAEVQVRQQAETELRKHRDHLEEMVTDRTAELAAANTQLEASYRREQAHRRLSDTLREVAKILSSTLELDLVLNLILAQLEKVVTFHCASISLLSGNALTIVAQRDESGQVTKGETLLVSYYPLREAVLQSRQPLLVPDVSRDERWRAAGAMGTVRSLINAPLLVQECPIGILSVGRRDETPYTEEEAQTVFAFANQVAVALEQVRLHEYELGQIEREMEIARRLQVSMLPLDAPQVAGLDISGCSLPARLVGGDFFNYFVFDQGRLGIAVGDVSGKGMQAALMMALSFGLLSTEVRRELTPSALLTTLNAELCEHTHRNGLNTALSYLMMQPNHQAWQVQVSNAGLIPPLVRRCNGTVEWLIARGLPLGAMEQIEYHQIQQTLQPGDVLVICSDGLAETMNEAGEMYGFDRMLESMGRIPYPGHALAIREHLLADMQNFAKNAEANDDVTIVVVVVAQSS